MRLYSPLITGVLLAVLAVVLAVPGNAAVNLTPISEYQNASVYVNTSTENLTMVGAFGNTSVYRSGGANVTLIDSGVRLDLGSAPEMGYRDAYIFVKMPAAAAFNNVTFDYDIRTGEKSNVLLIDFNASLPRIGTFKGGLKDQALLGIGTWSARYGEIGGLKDFPQGAHHVEIQASGTELVLRIDGKGVDVTPFQQKNYLVIHLMTGDGNSYLRGTISNIAYSGPPPGQPAATATPLPPFKLSATPKPSGITATPVAPIGLPGSDPDEEEPGAAQKSPLLSEVNFAFALIAAIGLFAAWAYVYFKYIRK